MKKIALVMILGLSITFLLSCSNGKTKLYVYTWSEYLAPELVKEFQNRYNCEIIFDYYDSNEAMYAKLKAGSNTYDVIFPSSYMAYVMYKQDMIRSLDKSKIPNLIYLNKKYSNKTLDADMNYSVPYVVSFTGLGYNSKEVKDIKPTWGMFGDRKYAHRMTMFDDMREAIGAALKYLGYSINTIDDKELARAKKLMLDWKKNLAAYQVDEAKTSLGAGILLLIQGYNGDIYQIEEDNPIINFVVPKEGTSIGLDDMVIPTGSQNPDLAYKFINFICDPVNSAKNMEYLYYLAPNDKALDNIDKDLREKLTIPDDIFDRSEVIHDLGKNNIKYIEMWDEIKAASI